MATNNFKAFGIGAGANVTSQSDYEALAALLTGFQSGKASSAQINKALRQSTTMAYVLAQFISDSAAVDVLDNGTPATILASLKSSMTALTPGRLLNVQVFTGSGSYTPTSGTKKIIVEVQAGGGAGGGTPATSSSQNSVASGGSSGQYIKSQLQISSLTLPVTVTVGIGGAGVSGSGGSGGGASSFGSYMTASGGFGGGAGSAASSAYVIQPGIVRSLPTSGNIDNGGGTPGGAGIFTQVGAGVSGNGGASRFGGGGNPGSVSGGGYTQAVGYGSGGAGAAVAASTAAQGGGAGGTGIVIVWEYA